MTAVVVVSDVVSAAVVSVCVFSVVVSAVASVICSVLDSGANAPLLSSSVMPHAVSRRTEMRAVTGIIAFFIRMHLQKETVCSRQAKSESNGVIGGHCGDAHACAVARLRGCVGAFKTSLSMTAHHSDLSQRHSRAALNPDYIIPHSPAFFNPCTVIFEDISGCGFRSERVSHRMFRRS